MNQQSVRVGLFQDASAASRAIQELLRSGIKEDAISAISKDEKTVESLGLRQREPGSEQAGLTAAAAGSAVGASVASAGATATMLMVGSAGLWVVGPFALLGGGIVGALVGAMSSRGIEEEASNFYQSEVSRGKILVAVKPASDEETFVLPLAEKVFAATGAQTFQLPRS